MLHCLKAFHIKALQSGTRPWNLVWATQMTRNLFWYNRSNFLKDQLVKTYPQLRNKAGGREKVRQNNVKKGPKKTTQEGRPEPLAQEILKQQSWSL